MGNMKGKPELLCELLILIQLKTECNVSTLHNLRDKKSQKKTLRIFKDLT